MKANFTFLPLLLLGLGLGTMGTRAASQPNAWQIADSSGAAGLLHYTNTLTAQQKIDATNQGWHFTVVSRLVGGSPSPNAGQFMIYGLGDRRFIVGWDTNDAGEFTARFTLTNGTTLFTNLTASGEATNDYHRHELVYDPVSREAIYLFDGTSLFSWAGLSNDANYNGQAAWGAASNGGRGKMNYHHVLFAIGGQIVSEYFAGSVGNPAVAPSPTNQGWTLTWTVPSTTLTNFPVSPDTAILPPVVVTQPATDVTTTSVTLNATVNPGNAATAFYFQFGLTTNYGNATPADNLSPGNSTIAVSNALAGLSPGTLYHFSIVASNSVGMMSGSDLTFATPPASPVSFPVSPAYTFATVAGNGGVGGADGAGSLAQFNHPQGVVVDAQGNIYVADTSNGTIRKITPAGVVTTLAGLAGNFDSADGTGSAARFNYPSGIVVDGGGSIYVADPGDTTIRRLTLTGTNWVVSTIAGFARALGSADGLGQNARFNYPNGIAVDSATNLFVTDARNHTIRKITPQGTNWVVSTLAGSPGITGSADGTNSAARFNNPVGIAIDGAGRLYVADTVNHTVRKIEPVGTNWVVSTIAGLANNPGTANGTNSTARFSQPHGVAVDGAGRLYVADINNHTIRMIVPMDTNWVVSTLAGTAGFSGSANGTGPNARFYYPSGVAADGAGNIIVADTLNSIIRRITTAAVVSTVAGAAGAGSADATGIFARFNRPESVAADAAGNVFVADTGNHTIRKITSAGVVSTIAGLAGSAGSADGAGSLARFNTPSGVAVAPGGDVYVADTLNTTIRRITPAGVVSTIAGLAGNGGYNDGTNSAGRFALPFGVAVQDDNTLYVADATGETIRKLTGYGTNWVVRTIAGLAGARDTVDGTNSDARFNIPRGMAVDSAGNLYVVESDSYTIRKITPSGTNWVVSTIAGLAGNFFPPADGINSVARFFRPRGIAVDGAGNLYVADSGYNSIRKIVPVGTNWVVSTIGGLARTPVSNQDAAGSTDGAGSSARFADPGGIAVDASGQLFIADTANNTIRRGVFTPYAPINAVPFSPPPMTGRLTVSLQPPEANGQWRFPWELGWHNSGTTASNLVAGNYEIEFRNVPGYLVLPILPVQVDGSGTTSITNQYYPTLSAGDANSSPGSLTVNLGPTPPAGARWGFLGAGTPVLISGFTTNLLPGTYLIEFAPVSGRVKPPSQTVQINAGLPSYLSVNYLLAATPPAGLLLPFPVPANQVNEETNYPFGFNGQLQSDTGYGSGVAVQTNVVLTAAHLVFSDQTLSYVSRAHWFFRRNAGVSEPLPQAARGFYVLSGYAAQRTNDLFSGSAPDQSTPPSRNLDVAALYFSQPVAGGGYGGYLPSDLVPNTWLASPTLKKMLVGYPVDGSQFGASVTAGKMYQTDPQTFPLNLATDPVPGQQQVYLAPWFLSYPGNSGGPLYVQFNGYYYPAAVYLGTLFSGSVPYASVVRAIDSNVVNLITRAASQGDSGTNYTGGGVITIIPSANINANNKAYLQVRLAPPSAVAAGAGWKLPNDASFGSDPNYIRQIISTNAFGVVFKSIPGWSLPASQAITVQPHPSVPTVVTGYYTVNSPLLATLRVAGTNRLAMSGTTGTVYRLESKSAVTNAAWLPVTTNTIRTNGFNPVLTNPAPGFYRLNWLTNF